VAHPSNVVTLPVPTRRQAAALFRRARLATGLSQEAAAQLCGVGVRTLRDWELGRVRMTQLEALVVLGLATNHDKKAA
jgi:DNA-binding transcriptional regulator YiaG